jgi:signal-transduction protein with cAMP-binding, CBS, and nucleotidyltransferase domain
MTDATVADAMTEPVLTVDPEDAIEDLADAMIAEGITSIVITGEDCQPNGILTGTDFIERVSDADAEEPTPVGDYMTTDIVTVDPSDPLPEAASLMVEQAISHVPVVDEETVVGILTASDLTEYLAASESA